MASALRYRQSTSWSYDEARTELAKLYREGKIHYQASISHGLEQSVTISLRPHLIMLLFVLTSVDGHAGSLSSGTVRRTWAKPLSRLPRKTWEQALHPSDRWSHVIAHHRSRARLGIESLKVNTVFCLKPMC